MEVFPLKESDFMRKLAYWIILMISITIFVSIVCMENVHGRTIHVDDDGQPDGNGSRDAPYMKIGYAIGNFSTGDSIFINNGYYEERIHIDDPMNITGENKNGVIISGGNESSVFTVRAENCRISNLWVKYGGMGNWDACFNVNSNNLEISNVILEYSKNGLYSNGGYHDINIDNTTIRNTNKGFYLNDFSNIAVDRVDIESNDFGMYLSSCRALNANNCNIYNNNDYGIFAHDSIDIIAERTWWGHENGPSVKSGDDKGDKIVDVDDYEPYLTSKYLNPDPPEIIYPGTLGSQKNVRYTYTFSCLYGKYPLQWNITTNATWLSVEENTIDGTPYRRDIGSYFIDVNVTDNDGRSNTMNITLIVNPNEQESIIDFQDTGPYVIHSLDPIDIQITNNDGDRIEYSAQITQNDSRFYVNGTSNYHPISVQISLKDKITAAGVVNISILVYDGFSNVSDSIEILAMYKPMADIENVTPTASKHGTIVSFEGNGIDMDGTVVGWEWKSDLDGVLSTEASFQNSILTPGAHSISLRVLDNDELWSVNEFVTVTIFALQEPIAESITLSPNSSIEVEEITFSGTGYDNDGSIIKYEWRSSIDGIFSSDSSGTIGTLSIGTHMISFRLKDDDGFWSNELSTLLQIQQQNTKPIITVTNSRLLKEELLSGEVAIMGNVEDNENNVQRVQISINSGNWQSAYGLEDWIYVWNTTKVIDGKHNLRIRADDGIENAEIVLVTVTVSNNNSGDIDDKVEVIADEDNTIKQIFWFTIGITSGIVIAVIYHQKNSSKSTDMSNRKMSPKEIEINDSKK